MISRIFIIIHIHSDIYDTYVNYHILLNRRFLMSVNKDSKYHSLSKEVYEQILGDREHGKINPARP